MTDSAPPAHKAPQQSRTQFWIRMSLRFVGPLLLVLLFVRMKDRGAVLDMLRSALGWQLALAIALNFITVHVKVLRWSALLRARGIVYPAKRAWSSFLASCYAGMLTPGRVGDVLRIQYLRHDLDTPYSEGLASVVMDRLCDLYVLAAMVALAVVRFRSVFAGELAYLTWITIALTVLGPLLFLIPGLAERFATRVYSKLVRGPGAGEGFAVFLQAMRTAVGKGLFVTIPLTIVAFGINFLQGYLLAGALGIPISFYDTACLLAIASLLGLLPISISGLGVRELIFSIIFPLLGYSSASGIGFGLLVFGVLYLFIVILGLIGWQIAPPPISVPVSKTVLSSPEAPKP